MFNKPAISARELELETAELLPSRETLCVLRTTGLQWHRPFWFGGGFNGFNGFDNFGVNEFGAFPFSEGFGGCGFGEGLGLESFAVPVGFEGGGFGGCGCF